MSNPTISTPKISQPTFSQENIDVTKESLKLISNDIKQYHHIYFNPKAKDKSDDYSTKKSKSKVGLPINYSLITRDLRIPQLENEQNEFYDLLKFYVETRSFVKLHDYIQMDYGTKISRRQMFYIAKKFDWKNRIEKFDSEYNFEIMSELHGKYADCKSKRLEIAVEIYENVNKLMDTFHNEVVSDLEFLAKYSHFTEEMKLKRSKDVLRIYTDYTKLTEKLDEIIEKENLNKFNPIEFENLDKIDETFEEMEEDDELNKMWTNFQEIINEKIIKIKQSKDELSEEKIEELIKKIKKECN